MKLEELTNAQGYHYRNRLLSFMKSKGYEGLGIMYNAVEALPELDFKLASGTDINGQVSEEEIERLSQQFELLRREFNERYTMFYDRCVQDSVVRDPLHDTFADSKPLVKSFIVPNKEIYLAVYDQTKGLGTAKSLEAFKQIITLENGLDLKKLIDECTEKAYS